MVSCSIYAKTTRQSSSSEQDIWATEVLLLVERHFYLRGTGAAAGGRVRVAPDNVGEAGGEMVATVGVS